ncbi:fatty acid synthase [Nephila pilipes]|uniref:Fatty acid synthase n=1 Tax=Nephila pilipes TaxID=299642 RepID=A0A8X6UU72_NEPPI|nr:fatty acid synthase [Nephila pilipes]
MGLKLMKINVFAESMRNSAEILKPFGVYLFEILRDDKEYLITDRIITPSFVTICAVQIALIDVMSHLNIKPDGIVGHSTGEIASAYADGCLTAKEALICAFHKGQAMEKANLPEGRTAAVDPKPRSKRWISTSYVENEWNRPECKEAGSEYFVNNMISSVYFNNAIKKIPRDAVIIEIGPHFLLLSILKRTIGSDASYIGLMKKNEKDNLQFFMNSLGR